MIECEFLDRTLMTLAMDYKLCLSPEVFARQLDAVGVPKDNRPAFLLKSHSAATTHFIERGDGTRVALVCFDPAPHKFVTSVGYLTHEAVHIWQEHRELVGEDNPSAETEAYGLQCIVESLVREFMRQKMIVMV
jgi:hypothetical protein